MKQTKEIVDSKTQQGVPPPVERLRVKKRKATSESITKQEIAGFWRQKRMEEEDHLLAAIEAAALIRARDLSMSLSLSEEDYNKFAESLLNEQVTTEKNNNKSEARVGVKDWWTKSKYAYLNQPPIGSVDAPASSTCTPNCF